ncbi:GNAT family N-acetyltransferase [Brevibacterium sp. 91QC2O2]|uniref:GNAT family N-acetyltransferase n=1 Tax=Brevibacterium sp. 91QC2O2 TaxID=2968458 RepID=UPI00211CA5F4|nr:GNAT family N-acetyltransferase [Brevibacterium sp. 91QC2O2]MCQ9367529.1 GNAT family N-acetyltransferase [Brevibacterium sp. 91QC2O2]
MADYRFETFEPGLADGAPDAQTTAYLQAVQAGFHEPRLEEEPLGDKVRRSMLDGRKFTAAYVDRQPEYALDPAVPVATFAHFEKEFNVGGGNLVDAHLITWVTVRPTHRRRGLLRALMTQNLANAATAGYPFAVLTATEGGIYRRFGFGRATWIQRVEVDTSPGFALAVEPDRRVEMCDPQVLRELAPQIYAQYMRKFPGAAGRQQSYVERAAGSLDLDTGKPDPKVRAALHFDEAGAPDGFVSYKISGWDDWTATIDIIDLVAVSDAAYSALWGYLGAIDLVNRVRYPAAATDSPLSWLLADPRRMTVKAVEDSEWLRILDVPQALEARPWGLMGKLTLSVTDSLGFGAGVFELTAADGRGTVVRLADEPDDAMADLSLDIAELGSLYLGGADPAVLSRAGRIRAARPEVVAQARAMFALERLPYSPNDF